MKDWFRKLVKRIKSSYRWRFVTKNRQIKWLVGLFCLIVSLITIIALVEISANDDFSSIWDIFYWAMVTITTVGYGDFTPKTIVGRNLTVLMIIFGVVLVSFMTATIASVLTATRIKEGMGLKKIESEDHIVICGYNFNVENIIRSIISSSVQPPPEVILVNSHPETLINDLIEHFPEAPIRYVHGDYTQESSLNRASIKDASSAIILADPGPDGTAKPDDRTLIALLAIKSISQDVRVCVELLNDSSEIHLKRAGVDLIIISGEFSGFLLANAVTAPGIPQTLKELMYVNNNSEILREKIPDDIVGMSFHDAVQKYLKRFGTILVGVITEKKSFNLETVLSGKQDAIDDFIRRKFDEAGRNLEVETKGLLSVNINPGRDYHITEDDYAVVITSKEEKTIT
ncbi:MAG: hypothetical protein HOC71_00805 [Candidatus Latescibacteria bacterium]|jgi:voltage-gated potassium channel|nr:hypothetical protein [Candidatus Latescibacterota bacterium]